MQKKETTAPAKEEVKAEVKDAVKTVETVAAEAAKTVETKAKEVEEKAKAAAKTTTKAAKTVAKKAAEAKKPGRKPAEKKAEAQVRMIVQYQNNDTDINAIQEKIKAQFVSEGHRAGAIKKFDIYIKPEEYSAYYVINEKFSGRVDLF